jgi:ribose 5-phosphate isomerase B
MPKRFVIASDHGGFELKEIIRKHLESLHINIYDLGTHDENSVDYPDYAHRLCEKILDGKATYGILVCGTGIGMSIAANRHKGIRAALCSDSYTAKMTREHNDSNVLCLGGRVIGPNLALHIVETFINTDFSQDRHLCRIEKIELLQ